MLFNATNHNKCAEYAKNNIIARLVNPDAKALKPVILKRKWHPNGENSVLP